MFTNFMKKPKEETRYPRLGQLGIPVSYEPVACVKHEDLQAGLTRSKLDRKKFSELFGVQTCPIGGFYPWDVEAVLERMLSGRKTGTQLWWD